jgi:hypothetical protein
MTHLEKKINYLTQWHVVEYMKIIKIYKSQSHTHKLTILDAILMIDDKPNMLLPPGGNTPPRLASDRAERFVREAI